MKVINKSFPYLLISFFAIFIFTQTSCNDDDNGEPQTADFNVSLSSTSTLKSSSYDEINIDIESVSIHISTDSSSTSGWFNLETNTGIFDLLDYNSGNDTLIGFDSLLQVQTVSQIRLLLGSENTIVIDSVSYDLETPSAQTSGLKIQVHAELLPENSYKVVLDFDADKSIVETGNNKYKLTPSIKATVIQQ